MSYFFRVFYVISLLAFVFTACTSTKNKQANTDTTVQTKEDTSDMSWQQRIISKFAFHTGREHKQERKLKDEYERQKDLAEKNKSK